MKILNRLAWVAVGFTFLLVALGGTVRATNSGLSCPDWPLCFGRPYAPFNLNAQLEETHRYIAGIVSVLVVLMLLGALRWARHNRHILIPALIAPFFLVIQIILGGLTVLWDLPPQIIAAHLGTALIIFALEITIAVMSGKELESKELPEQTRKFARLAITNAILLYGLLLSGSYVVGSSASLACSSWPLCGTPAEGAVQYHLTDIDLFHRYVAVFIGLVMLWTIIAAIRRRKYAPGQAMVAVTGGVLFICQSGVGALIVFLKKPDWAAALHLGTASAVWGFMVLLAVMAAKQLRDAPRGEQLEVLREEVASQPQKEPGPLQQAISGYINLMKPHVTVLLLGTTVAAMAIAKQGLPSLPLILATLIGGAMAAGSANSINCYIDRDIDQVMSRTQRRSLPAGRVQPTQALIFGLLLGVGSFVIFSLFVNMLSAWLSLSAILFYVIIYTLWLKRSSAQNIVIGGAAGAVPVLIGWAAVTNTITLPAIWLFAIIFYWTPPHFWALSLLIEKDYAKAHIPMLPVVMGERETKKQILLYSLMLLAVTLVLFSMQAMGYFYLVCAVILGAILVYMSVRLILDKGRKWARTIFWYSNCYLALIFAVMVLDRVIH
jgi:protoheme IX farnesyltransferase